MEWSCNLICGYFYNLYVMMSNIRVGISFFVKNYSFILINFDIYLIEIRK